MATRCLDSWRLPRNGAFERRRIRPALPSSLARPQRARCARPGRAERGSTPIHRQHVAGGCRWARVRGTGMGGFRAARCPVAAPLPFGESTSVRHPSRGSRRSTRITCRRAFRGEDQRLEARAGTRDDRRRLGPRLCRRDRRRSPVAIQTVGLDGGAAARSRTASLRKGQVGVAAQYLASRGRPYGLGSISTHDRAGPSRRRRGASRGVGAPAESWPVGVGVPRPAPAAAGFSRGASAWGAPAFPWQLRNGSSHGQWRYVNRVRWPGREFRLECVGHFRRAGRRSSVGRHESNVGRHRIVRRNPLASVRTIKLMPPWFADGQRLRDSAACLQRDKAAVGAGFQGHQFGVGSRFDDAPVLHEVDAVGAGDGA